MRNIRRMTVTMSACAAMSAYAQDTVVTDADGPGVFLHYCALCHGDEGRGDGRMARLITSPSPADLTRSTLSRDGLRQIIGKGGEAVGRSAKMPSWEQQLTTTELSAVVAYVYSLKPE
ncbi:MAG: cytochrome c [Gammaproteobacteria bacterium]